MTDVNYQLREAYFSLLSGNVILDSVAIPVYNAQVPITDPPLNPDNYILINTIYSTGFNDDRFNYTQTAVQLMIVTKAIQNNSGYNADYIAGQIFALIYPDPVTQPVQISAGQVVNTVLNQDVTQPQLTDGQKKVLNRILTFSHKVQHSRGVFGNIYFGVQANNSTPTDFSRSLRQNPDLPVSINYGLYSVPKFYWVAIPGTATLKTDWQDLNNTTNAGQIGAVTDLFQVSSIVIGGFNYNLYMTDYLTGFNGYSSIVRFFNL